MKIKRNFKDGRCTHVDILHTGYSQEQNFSTRLVTNALSEGWMSMQNGEIILKASPEDLVYKILRGPGYYCCFDHMKFDDAVSAKNHVDTQHKGEKSPDPNNPHGYEKINHYHCILDAAQHNKYKINAVKTDKKSLWERIKGAVNG